LKDELDFLAEAKAGTLPPVSFVKPLYDEHSNYTTETDSETHTVSLLQAITSSPSWSDTVVIITYDENGGFWDHHGGARRRSGCAIPCANVSAYVSRAARAISRGWRSPHSRFAENFVG
jgi:phospholipase C